MHISVPPLRTIVAMRCQYVSDLWREHASCDLVADVLMEITAFLDDVSNSLAFCSEEVELSKAPSFIFFHEGVLKGVFEEGENLVLNTLPSLSDPRVIAPQGRHIQRAYHDDPGDRLVIFHGAYHDPGWDSKILVYDLQGRSLLGEWYTTGLDSTSTTSGMLNAMAAVGNHVFFGVSGRHTMFSDVLVAVLEPGTDVAYLKSIWHSRDPRCMMETIFPVEDGEDRVAVEVAYTLDDESRLLRISKIPHPRSQTLFSVDAVRPVLQGEAIPEWHDSDPRSITESKLLFVGYTRVIPRTDLPPRVERKFSLTDSWGVPYSPPMWCNRHARGDLAVDSSGVLHLIHQDYHDDKTVKLCRLRCGFLLPDE